MNREIIYQELCTIGIPVYWLISKEYSNQYIIIMLLFSRSSNHADDDYIQTENHYRVGVYSKGDYQELVNSVIKKLKELEAYGISIEAEIYEQDTDYYHIPIEFYVLEGEE